MKILAIGDFHGKFPEKLKNIVKKEKIDLILSDGDYAGISDFRPALKKMFKLASQGKQFSFEDYFGKGKYKKLLEKDYNIGKNVLKQLNKLNVPVISVFGNGDWYKSSFNEVGKFYENDIMILKNIKDINTSKTSFKKIKITGFGGYMDPDIYFTKKGIKKINGTAKSTKKRRKRYAKAEKKLFSLMKNNPNILITHYTPYKCLDKLKTKNIAFSGENMGVSSFNRVIKKFKPELVICGHMHENQGKCKLASSLVVNPGAAVEGKCAFIDFDEDKKKVLNVRFVR